MQGNVAFQAIVFIKFVTISAQKLPCFISLQCSTMLQGLIFYDGSSQVIETFNFEDECSKECEHFLLSRNGDDFGRKKQLKPTYCESFGAPLRKQISKQFAKIITLPGASAYGIVFEKKIPCSTF